MPRGVPPDVDFHEYMKANLLVPFGMTSSGYLWDDDLERHAARPHDAMGTLITKPRPTRPAVARYGSAGGLLTTPTDYAKFLVEVMAPKQSDSFRLRADSVKEMLRPHVRVPDTPFSISWSLGWRISHTDRGDVLNHDGGQDGFRSFGGFSAERKSGLVVMANGDNGDAVIEKLLFGDMMVPVL
jgi:CubicO group peptidase (beta-lactamase class C family)